MRFLRGLGIGFSMFFIWIIFSVLAAFSFIGEYGLGQEFDLSLASPIFSIPMIIGFFGMFIGPIYYWVIEPFRESGKPPKQTYFHPSQPAMSPRPGQHVASFCHNCGTEYPRGHRFCEKCGTNLGGS